MFFGLLLNISSEDLGISSNKSKDLEISSNKSDYLFLSSDKSDYLVDNEPETHAQTVFKKLRKKIKFSGKKLKFFRQKNTYFLRALQLIILFFLKFEFLFFTAVILVFEYPLRKGASYVCPSVVCSLFNSKRYSAFVSGRIKSVA